MKREREKSSTNSLPSFYEEGAGIKKKKKKKKKRGKERERERENQGWNTRIISQVIESLHTH